MRISMRMIEVSAIVALASTVIAYMGSGNAALYTIFAGLAFIGYTVSVMGLVHLNFWKDRFNQEYSAEALKIKERYWSLRETLMENLPEDVLLSR